MRRRWRLAVAPAVCVGMCLLVTPAAWASYNVVASCQSNGQVVACDGWHVSPIEISWTWTPSSSGTGDPGCVTQYFGSDTETQVTCEVTGSYGSGSTPQDIDLESSNPTATAVLARPPDANGWYNHPVAVSFLGGFSFSGFASCTPATTYGGPDVLSTTVSGGCTDNAGKVAGATIGLRYDATPPSIDVSAAPGDGVVNLSWDAHEAIAPVSPITIVRRPGRKGARTTVMHRASSGSIQDSRVRNGVRYEYTITTTDEAGNLSVRKVFVTPGPRLLAPTNGTRTAAPPMLRWTPVRNATYYNVQLYNRGKVLSAWPKHARLRLGRRWRFGGHLYRLKPGRYRWYVWPGFGPRSAARYGPIVGKGKFVIVSAKPGAAVRLAFGIAPRVAPDARR
jgi:hypothetical protein